MAQGSACVQRRSAPKLIHHACWHILLYVTRFHSSFDRLHSHQLHPRRITAALVSLYHSLLPRLHTCIIVTLRKCNCMSAPEDPTSEAPSFPCSSLRYRTAYQDCDYRGPFDIGSNPLHDAFVFTRFGFGAIKQFVPVLDRQ